VPAARAAPRRPRKWLASKRAPESGLDGRLPRAFDQSSTAQRRPAAPDTSPTRRHALDDPVSRLTKYTPTASPGRLRAWDKYRSCASRTQRGMVARSLVSGNPGSHDSGSEDAALRRTGGGRAHVPKTIHLRTSSTQL